MPEPTALIEQIVAAFEAAGWQYRRVDGQAVIESEFEAHSAKVPLHVQGFDQLGIISAVARLSFTIRPAALAATLELLSRTNLTLTVGNFECDPDAAEVFFRSSNVFPGNNPDPSSILSLVRNAVVEMDRLTPFLSELQNEPMQSIPALMARQDLLPEIGEAG